MGHAKFVHLRVHSAYSLSEGAIKLNELSELCLQERMPAVAITDRNNLFGAIEFSETCKRFGIQPILGCEIAISLKPSIKINTEGEGYPSIVLLAQNKVGSYKVGLGMTNTDQKTFLFKNVKIYNELPLHLTLIKNTATVRKWLKKYH